MFTKYTLKKLNNNLAASYSSYKHNVHKIIITHNLNLAYKLKYDILYIKDHKIVFYDTNEKFFDEQNLQFFFQGSVKKCDDNIVVNI